MTTDVQFKWGVSENIQTFQFIGSSFPNKQRVYDVNKIKNALQVDSKIYDWPEIEWPERAFFRDRRQRREQVYYENIGTTMIVKSELVK